MVVTILLLEGQRLSPMAMPMDVVHGAVVGGLTVDRASAEAEEDDLGFPVPAVEEGQVCIVDAGYPSFLCWRPYPYATAVLH